MSDHSQRDPAIGPAGPIAKLRARGMTAGSLLRLSERPLNASRVGQSKSVCHKIRPGGKDNPGVIQTPEEIMPTVARPFLEATALDRLPELASRATCNRKVPFLGMAHKTGTKMEPW